MRLFSCVFWIVLLSLGMSSRLCVAAPAGEARQLASLHFAPADNGAPVISIPFNGRDKVRFVVDTGAAGSMITDRLAAQLGLKAVPFHALKGSMEQDETGAPLQVINDLNLNIGDAHFVKVSLLVVKASLMNTLVGPDVDGIIGANLLSEVAVLFDFQQQEVALWHGDLSAGQLAALKLDNAYHAPLVEGTIPNFYRVPVSVNGAASSQAIVDTGSWITTILHEESERLHLQPLAQDTSARVFIGSFPVTRARVASVHVGEYTAADMVVQYASKAEIAGDGLDKAPQVLGLDFLTQHRVLLDYPHHRLYFKPATQQTYATTNKTKTFGVPAIEAVLQDGKPHLIGLEPSSYTCINKPAAEAIAASPLAPDALRDNKQVLLSRLSLPGTSLALEAIPLPIVEFEKVGINAPQLEGILGGHFLNRYALRLDMTQGKVALMAPGHLQGTGDIAKSAIRLPLLIAEDGYVTQMLVDGTPATFFISLLNTTSILSSKALVSALHPTASLDEVGADTKSRHLRLHSIGVEGALWSAPEVWDRSSENLNINVLGIDFFRRFHVTFDFPAQYMYLEPDADFHAEERKASCGIVYPTFAEGRTFVGSVYSPSPAQEAGIQAGDEILSVNGKPVQSTPLESINMEFKKPEGAEIVVQIRRKEEKPRNVTLKMRKLF